MSDIFPKWTNKLPLQVGIGAVMIGTALTWGATYYFTPKYSRVGYQPIQPVAFSHNIHVTQLGLDCRYCHNGVDRSWFSNVPAASTCMNCHSAVLKDSPKLALVRESYQSGQPIPWIHIHKLPDYVYFNHSVHVTRGISCVECHGQIDKMDVVYHAKPFSMNFCLECHRDPAAHIRPVEKVTDLEWKWSDDPKKAAEMQLTQGRKMVHDWNVQSLQYCSSCHR